MPDYFDIHSHIQDRRFDDDIDGVLSRMKALKLSSIVVGVDYKSSVEAIKLAKYNDGIFASVGLHPTDVLNEDWNENRYIELAKNDKVVAIGECGLDYLRAKNTSVDEKNRQKERFVSQIDIAVKLDKPLMVHCREAHNDAIDILKSKKREYGEKLRGNIHFFSEGTSIAKQYFDLGFTISFTGVITFTSDYDEVVKYAPITHIMSETDCPYVAPVPYRGSRNEPAYVVEVVKKIAEIRGENEEDLKSALVQNALRVFDIKPLL